MQIQPNSNQVITNPCPTILFEHQGTFDDMPATYQTCQTKEVQYDQITFNNDDQPNESELLQHLKTTPLVKSSSVIITLHSEDQMTLRFNYS